MACFWTNLVNAQENCSSAGELIVAEFVATNYSGGVRRAYVSTATWYGENLLSGLPDNPPRGASPETIAIYDFPGLSIYGAYGTAPAQSANTELASGQFRSTEVLYGSATFPDPGTYSVAVFSEFNAYMVESYPYLMLDGTKLPVEASVVFTGTNLSSSTYGWTLSSDTDYSETISSSDTMIACAIPPGTMIGISALYFKVQGGDQGTSEFQFVSEASVEVPGPPYQAGEVTDLFIGYGDYEPPNAPAPEDRELLEGSLELLSDETGYFFRVSSETYLAFTDILGGTVFGTLVVGGTPMGLVRFFYNPDD